MDAKLTNQTKKSEKIFSKNYFFSTFSKEVKVKSITWLKSSQKSTYYIKYFY